MADLAQPELRTIKAIYRWYEDQERSWDNAGLPSSYMAHPCDRMHWYAFRWAAHAKPKEGRILRLFDTGKQEEDRIIEDLKRIGCEVSEVNPQTGKQWKFYLASGHVVVKPDGIVTNVPDAPNKPHMLECKTAKAKDYNAIVKHGLHKHKPDHYIQCQLQMHARGIDRCLYIIKNKDTEDLHGIRLHHDPDFCAEVLKRAEQIISTDWAPPKLHDDPEKKAAWQCRFCDFRGVCHDGDFSRVNCRTCLHAQVGPAGKWLCTKHGGIELDYRMQQDGCGDHLYLPDLVPGQQVDHDDKSVTYELANGGIFTDAGHSKQRKDAA